MKWVLPSVQVTLLYLFAVVFLIDLNLHTSHYLIILILGILLLISSAMNIVYTIKCASKSKNISKERKKLRTVMLVFKFLSIPFFVVNFFVFAIAALLPLIFILWIFYPIVIIATYFLMLVTSSYSIAVLILYNRSNLLSKRTLVIHIILQLIFVVDVVDAIYLFGILRKKDLGSGDVHAVFTE